MKSICIKKGKNGWGGPLIIKVEDSEKEIKKVLSITGGGIDPIAQTIANMLEIEAVDGMIKAVEDENIACVVINCGGTLRCGVYPQKRVPTVNTTPVGKSGPLAKYILEDIYVSDVNNDSLITYTDDVIQTSKTINVLHKEDKDNNTKNSEEKIKYNYGKGFLGIITKIGVEVGKIISLFYQSGREAIDVVIGRVIPFMAFISIFIAFIQETSLGNIIANGLSPLSGTLWGLLILAAICGLPFLSPILGPGAAIAQVIGILIGTNIGAGIISPVFALPALFAINVQVGADFVPVGLSMQRAEPETIEIGTPAFLLSRQITGPLAVIIGYLLSIGLF
mgnify:CR=1 FL=1